MNSDDSRQPPAYSAEFYSEIDDGSLRSARVIVPMLYDMLKPRSVIDVGCGAGNFLHVFNQLGVEDVLGVDGDYLCREDLKIDTTRFMPHDLAHPLSLRRSFDLAISLEVAEHIEENSAPDFIASLVSLSPVIAFSAAIPYQGGQHHINCQWPEYWQALFHAHDYLMVDLFRPALMADDRVEWWYAQNLLLVAHRDIVSKHPNWLSYVFSPARRLVHPDLYAFNSRKAGFGAQVPNRPVPASVPTETATQTPSANTAVSLTREIPPKPQEPLGAECLSRDAGHTPLLSVILPVFNCGRYLAKSIESLLTQSFADFELIIIDDGSTDQTRNVITDYCSKDSRIQPVLFDTNQGLINALNRGLTLARGQFIGRQDGDDWSHPHRLQRQVLFLDSHPEIGVVGTAGNIINAEGVMVEKAIRHDVETDAQIRFRHLFNTAFMHPTLIFRRELIDKYHLRYDPACPHAEDYDLAIRMLEHTRGYVLLESLYDYRQHGESVSHVFPSVQAEVAYKISNRYLQTMGIPYNLSADEKLQMLCIYVAIMIGKPVPTAQRSLLQTLLAITDHFFARTQTKDAKLFAFRKEIAALLEAHSN